MGIKIFRFVEASESDMDKEIEEWIDRKNKEYLYINIKEVAVSTHIRYRKEVTTIVLRWSVTKPKPR